MGKTVKFNFIKKKKRKNRTRDSELDFRYVFLTDFI